MIIVYSCSSQDLKNTGTDLMMPMNISLNGKKWFSYHGAKLWNALAIEVKQTPSLSVVRQKLNDIEAPKALDV